MTVLTVPHGGLMRPTVMCAICLCDAPLQEMTAGSQYADGHQAFACSSHLADRTAWIIGWATFEAHQNTQTQTTPASQGENEP